MRTRWLSCLLIIAVAALPALADPPPTTQKSDGEKQNDSARRRKARGTRGRARAEKHRDARADDASGKKNDHDQEKRIRRDLAAMGLRMVIEDATFEEMTFEDFTEWLARTTEANVVVRWRVLEKGGVERAFPIYVKQKKIRVRKLLQIVFSQVTEELHSVEIAARADGNTLIISTRKDINTKRVTRVYEARHMMLLIPDFGGPAAPEPGSGGASGGSGTGGITKSGRGGGSRRSRGPATGGGTSERQPDVDAETQRLIDAITQTIQPLSWKVNGGKGTIRYFQGKLVVYNNLEVHQSLEEMFPEPGE